MKKRQTDTNKIENSSIFI